MTSDYVGYSPIETSCRPLYNRSRLGVRGRRWHRGSLASRPATTIEEEPHQDGTQSTVYVFSDANFSEDEICNDDFELIQRFRQTKAEESLVTYVEIPIKEGDTLANIALRYSCKVADLKLVNKLIRDQDFYGLQKIRVPLIKHGVLAEQIHCDAEKKIEASCDCKESKEDDGISVNLCVTSEASQMAQAEQLLLRMDEEMRSLTSTNPHDADLNHVLRPSLNRQISRSLNWRTALMLFLVLCVVIPIIIGLWFIFSDKLDD